VHQSAGGEAIPERGPTLVSVSMAMIVKAIAMAMTVKILCVNVRCRPSVGTWQGPLPHGDIIQVGEQVTEHKRVTAIPAWASFARDHTNQSVQSCLWHINLLDQVRRTFQTSWTPLNRILPHQLMPSTKKMVPFRMICDALFSDKNFSRLRNIRPDLLQQRLYAIEFQLFSQILHKLQFQLLAVQLAVEVQQVGFQVGVSLSG